MSTKSVCLPGALALAICLALHATPAAAQSQDAATADKQEGAKTLDKVEVTGSRIKRTEIETVDPIQVFTAQELAKQGYATLYDALSNL
ncbi:MAG: hypothetical protein OJK14_17170, partial [Achromobacter sp.]|uniref:hypothetical protein n=1 Tax=Achromobacter sp. TaxID=134375 RepID=UPI0025878DA8